MNDTTAPVRRRTEWPVWVWRAGWLLLPVTLGDLVADALAGTDGPGATVVGVTLWVLWAAGLACSLVADPRALTTGRTLAPLPLVAGVAAALTTDPTPLGWVGLVVAALVPVVALSAPVGEWAIDGASYGDEHRSPLRCPGILLLGPLQLTWVATVGPLAAALLLAARDRWLPAAVAAALGTVTAVAGWRSLHRLASRALVFVPTGITLVDALALYEPIPLPRRSIVRLGPAPADTAALDLTAGATGLIVEAALDEPLSVVPAVRRGATTEAVEVRAVLVAPSRPGRFLEIAEQRGIRVGRS